MKKNLFIKSTLILAIGSMLTKTLGFIIRIIFTRIIGEEGISLYMLVMPTYSLLVAIASLGLPVAVSKLVAEGTRRGRKIFFSVLPTLIIINTIIIVAIIYLSPTIASNLLNEPRVSNFIVAMSLVLPFISLSSLIRGYFFGKQNMLPHTLSNVIEQITRLILVIIFIPRLLKISVEVGIIGLILLSIISEIVSIIVFLVFLPKNFKIKKEDIKPDLGTVKDVFSTSIPALSSRLIGNVGYFFEPIILTNLLIYIGYSKDFVILEYGIFNAYTLSLLFMPSFFVSAISTSLIPEISKFFALRNIKMIKKRINQAIKFTFIVSLFLSIFMFIFYDKISLFIFNTNSGATYFRVLVPFFLLFYIEAPLISSLQALNEAKTTMKITTIGVFIKLGALTVFSLCKIGIYGLIIAEIINIIFVVSMNYYYLKKTLNKYQRILKAS